MIHFIQMTQLVRPGSPSTISAIPPNQWINNLVMELTLYYSHRYPPHTLRMRRLSYKAVGHCRWNLERGSSWNSAHYNLMTCACFSPSFHLFCSSWNTYHLTFTLPKKVFLNRCSKTFLYSFYSLFIDPYFTFLTSAQIVHLIQGAADVKEGFAGNQFKQYLSHSQVTCLVVVKYIGCCKQPHYRITF